MAENTDSISSIRTDSEPTPLLNHEAIMGRLKDRRDDVIDLPGGTSIRCIVGIDPEKQLSQSGWSCFIEQGQEFEQGVTIETKAGEVVNLKSADKPLATTEIKKVSIHGKEYTLSRDMWGNPYYYAYVEATETEISPKVKEGIGKSIELWEAALEGETPIRQKVVELYGQEVMDNISGFLIQIEQYPELQDFRYWTANIDLWEIAQKGKTYAGAMEILNGQQGGETLPIGFNKTAAFNRCSEVLRKMVNRQALAEADRHFIGAIAFTPISIEQSIRDIDVLKVTDITRPFAIANIMENLICREVVGWHVFEQHQADFDNFTTSLSEAGYTVPAWFKPYQGDEFRWSFALDSFVANAKGKFFLDPRWIVQ